MCYNLVTSVRAANLGIQEVVLAQKRMELEGRETRKPYTWAKVKKIVLSARFWLLVLLYV
jgi:ACS family pantothenate transporter-like MFS transporter